MTPYQQSLQHPLWQKKRLEILEAAGWRCRFCGSEDDQLHAHHIFYRKNTEPWDYEDAAFIALCDSCHEREHKVGDEAWRLTKRFLVHAGCQEADIAWIGEWFDGVKPLARQEWPAFGRCIRMILQRRNDGADLSDIAREIEDGGVEEDGRDDDGFADWVASGKPDIDPGAIRESVSSEGDPF